MTRNDTPACAALSGEELQTYVDDAKVAFARQECALNDVRSNTLVLLQHIIAQIGPDLLPLLCEPIALSRPRSSPSSPIAGTTFEVGGIALKFVSQPLAGSSPSAEIQRIHYLLANGTEGLEITRRVTSFPDLTTEWSTLHCKQMPLEGLLKAVRVPVIIDAVFGRLKAQGGRMKAAAKLSRLANKLHAILTLLETE